MILRLICVTALLLAFVPIQVLASDSDFGKPISLRQILTIALERSPALNSSARELEIARLEESAAFSKFLPSLAMTTTHGLQGDSPKTLATPWASRLNLAFTETLYDNGVSLARYTISKLKIQAAEGEFKRQRAKLYRDLATEYMRHELAQHSLQFQQEQNQRLSKIVKITEINYRQGLKPKKDYLRFQAVLRRSEIDLLDATNSIEKSRLEIVKLMGLTEEESRTLSLQNKDDVKIPDQIPSTFPPIAESVDSQIANLQKEVASHETDLVARNLWPIVTVSSSVDYGSASYIDSGSGFLDNDKLQWNALLAVQFNLWDWGLRQSDKAVAEQKRLISANALDGQLNTLRTERAQLLNNLKRLKQSNALAIELLNAEQNSINILDSEYRNGRVSYFEFVEGLKDLTDAKSRYYSSLFELKQGLISYWYYDGSLFERLTQD